MSNFFFFLRTALISSLRIFCLRLITNNFLKGWGRSQWIFYLEGIWSLMVLSEASKSKPPLKSSSSSLTSTIYFPGLEENNLFEFIQRIYCYTRPTSCKLVHSEILQFPKIGELFREGDQKIMLLLGLMVFWRMVYFVQYLSSV